MGAVWFLIVAVGLASAGIGAVNSGRLALSQRWFQTGDSHLFFEAWAADIGRTRVLLAAALAILVIAAAKAGPAKLRKPSGWALRVFGGLGAVAGTLALLAFCHIGTGAMRPDPGDRPSVLFVMLDTLRLDYTGWGAAATGQSPGLPESATPQLDRFAAEGIAFTQAIASAPWTKPSVGTMLTGMAPSRHLAVGRPGRGYYPDMPAERRLITEAFASAGYDTAAVSTNPNIAPRYGFHQGCHYRFDEDVPAERVIELSEAWLAGRERPFFLYAHFNDAHYPFEPPAPFRGKFDTTGSTVQLTGPTEKQFRKGEVEWSESDREHLRLAYAEEVAHLDDQVGQFVRRQLDANPNLIVVIVSDHGEEFFEHGDVGHGHTLHEELLRVPMQFLRSGDEWKPRQIDSQVGLVDLMPTLLDACELPWPEAGEQLDGRSFLGWLEGGPTNDRTACAETDSDGSPRSGYTGPLRGLREPHRKLVRTLEHSERPGVPVLYWYFDLAADPRETVNALAANEAAARELDQKLQQSPCFTEKLEAPLHGAVDTSQMSEQQRIELDELGYIDDGGPLPQDFLDRNRDPLAPQGLPLVD